MEIAAFSNFKGGTILLGITDEGQIAGLTRNDNEERIINICSDLIEPRIVPEYWQITIDGKKIAVITIDPGREKPYAVIRHGKRNYYIRVGSTVRESTRRELLRMFQDSAMLHVEALPTASDFRELDRGLITDYFLKYRNINLNDFEETEFKRILINSSIMNEDEQLTIAGCLLFSKNPGQFYAGAGISILALLTAIIFLIRLLRQYTLIKICLTILKESLQCSGLIIVQV